MGFEPMTPSLPWKCSTPELHRLEKGGTQHPCPHFLSTYFIYRAGDETRTRDIQLGRLMLYQLSYARVYNLTKPLQFPPFGLQR